MEGDGDGGGDVASMWRVKVYAVFLPGGETARTVAGIRQTGFRDDAGQTCPAHYGRKWG